MKNLALITGASSGIGKELARIHAKNGGDLIITARSALALEDLQKELIKNYHVSVIVLPANLSHPHGATTLINEITALGLCVEILINNAGFGEWGQFADTPWQKEYEMVTLNCLALTQLTKAFLPSMLSKKSGKILNVASTASFQPGPYMSIYYATKAFVLSFSEALRYEVLKSGVTVTALCPGPTESGFQNAANINSIPLITGRKLPSSHSVAHYGYNAMLNGKRIAIPGILNKILVFFVRILPRNVIIASVASLQKKRYK